MSTKQECPKCKRILRAKCFRVNKANGEEWCRQCINKYGENKFNFNPDIPFRNHRVTKYGLSSEEETELRRIKGITEVKKLKGFLGRFKESNRLKRIDEAIKRNEQLKENKDMNKKLIEGLQ